MNFEKADQLNQILGLTVQTFYGHLNTINDVVFNSRGDILYSCDGDGIVKVWDIRKVSEM